MRIVIAPNAFKECLSAPDVAEAIAQGVKCSCPDAEIIKVPLADGGDGTAEALVAARGGQMINMTASDPLMRPVDVQYGLFDNGQAAVIEMAIASGLWRLNDDEKNPLKTTTYGTGEMIRDALERGVRTMVVGIGGSATTDAGIGMANALGYKFLDANGNTLPPTGESMNAVTHIDSSNVHPAVSEATFLVASDVTNPLLGVEGAALVYGPQKGATPDMVETLEQGLSNIEKRWYEDMGVRIGDMPGGGAAGGLGAGLAAFCGAEIRSGFDLVADYAKLDDALDGASLVITGEGKIDASTQFGKVPAGVVKRAKMKCVPVIGLAGAVSSSSASLESQGMMAVFSIVPGPIDLQEAMNRAEEFLQQTTKQVINIWRYKA
jgi:glycerate 2-kinase